MESIRLLLRSVLPYILRLTVLTVLDCVAAWRGIHVTIYVLICFFTGRSHLSYPHPPALLKRRKAELARRRRQLQGSPSQPMSPALDMGEWFPGDPRQSSAAAFPRDCFVQRRVLHGRKGEQTEWLPRASAAPLVPAHYHLSFSESLHRLVGNVVGPIQQPTVAALPTRHIAPQWPPHIPRPPLLRQGGHWGELNATTDEYSSSTSAPRRPQRMIGEAVVGPKVPPGVSTVVYRRVNSEQVQFDRTVTTRSPSHPIASITSHHVLSYQATRQKVLIMDLDETLCHVSTRLSASRRPPTFSEVIPTANGAELFHVWERPHARLFLCTMAKLFNIALFTSSTKPYADSILRRLDPEQLIKRRYYRQHCRQIPRSALAFSRARSVNNRSLSSDARSLDGRLSETPSLSASDGVGNNGYNSSKGSDNSVESIISSAEGLAGPCPTPPTGTPRTKVPVANDSDTLLVKDLRVLKVPPELMIMIDNAEEFTILNRENALIVPPFFPPPQGEGSGDRKDETAEESVLFALIPFLEALLVVPDVRSILRHGRQPYMKPV